VTVRGALSILTLTAIGTAVGACVMHDPAPRHPQLGPAGGYAPLDFDTAIACGSWDSATVEWEAKKHDTFPEPNPVGCHTRVGYAGPPEQIVAVGDPPEGCTYPRSTTRERLLARAALYDRVARGDVPKGVPVPLEIACKLPAGVRKRAAVTNGNTLRSLAASMSGDGQGGAYPYSLAGTFGFGAGRHEASKLVRWAPGDACVPLDASDRDLLDVNVHRAARIAEAYRVGLAPVVSTSGAAVHSPVVEAFMLAHLAHCDGGVPIDRILVDPCADHTHTNIRNTGSLVVGIDGRFAYLVTDDGLQSLYMQEWTTFELLGGSIDQRARRDWGHLIGTWRQASHGIDAGFWFSPYRFWAEPEDGLGSFHCVGDRGIEEG
jgi:hypothetical protein